MLRCKRCLLLPLIGALTFLAGCASTVSVPQADVPLVPVDAAPEMPADDPVNSEVAEASVATPEPEDVSWNLEELCSSDFAVTARPGLELDLARTPEGFWFLDQWGSVIPFLEVPADQMWVLDTDQAFAGPTLFVLVGTDRVIGESEFQRPDQREVGEWLAVAAYGGGIVHTTVLVRGDTAIRLTAAHVDAATFETMVTEAVEFVDGTTDRIADMTVRRSGDPATTDYSIDANHGRRTDDAMSVSWLCSSESTEGELLPFDPLMAYWLALQGRLGTVDSAPFHHEGLPGVFTRSGPDNQREHLAFVMGNDMMMLLEDDTAVVGETAADFAAKFEGRYGFLAAEE